MTRLFSTDALRDGRAVDCWRAWLSNEFLPVDIQDYDTKGFRARCELTEIGELEISTLTGTRQSVVRPKSLIGASDADVYVAAVTGTTAFDHNGHHGADARGSVVLFDVTRPYALSHGPDADVLCVVVPRRRLDEALGIAQAAAGLALTAESATARLIQDFFTSLIRNAGALEPSAARRLAAIGIDLIAAGFAERLSVAAPRRPSEVAMLVRARAFIEDHLGDPDLDVARIAAAVRVSPRRLHELFAAQETSVADYVWDRRLLRARKLLADPACSCLTIQSVAFRTGFSSQAHFARRFKARFGTSPSCFRAQQPGSGG